MSFLPSLVLPFLEPADVFVAAGINKNWRQAASLLLRTLDGPAFLQSRRLAASAAVKPKVTKSNVAGAKSKLKKQSKPTIVDATESKTPSVADSLTHSAAIGVAPLSLYPPAQCNPRALQLISDQFVNISHLRLHLAASSADVLTDAVKDGPLFPKLISLEVGGISDASLTAFLKLHPTIVEVRVCNMRRSDSTSRNEKDFLAVLLNSSHLQVLHIGEPWNTTNPKHLPSLYELRSSSSVRLRELHLYHCVHPSDLLASLLRSPACASLKSFRVWSLTSDDTGHAARSVLRTALTSCPNLSDLEVVCVPMPRQPSITREALTELIDSVTPSALKHIALCLTWSDLEVPEDAEDTLQRLVNAWDTLESVTLVTEHVHETLLLDECAHILWTFKNVSDRDLASEYYDYWCSRDYV